MGHPVNQATPIDRITPSTMPTRPPSPTHLRPISQWISMNWASVAWGNFGSVFPLSGQEASTFIDQLLLKKSRNCTICNWFVMNSWML